MSDDLLKVKDAAKRIGLSARTLYALAAAGKIACYRLGVGDSAVRFAPSDLDAYLASCRSPATTRGAGSTSSTVKFQGLEESALTSYFRKAGRAPKQKPTTSTRQRADTPLKLAYSENNT